MKIDSGSKALLSDNRQVQSRPFSNHFIDSAKSVETIALEIDTHVTQKMKKDASGKVSLTFGNILQNRKTVIFLLHQALWADNCIMPLISSGTVNLVMMPPPRICHLIIEMCQNLYNPLTNG